MIRSILSLAAGAVLLCACAAGPGTQATRDDDTYVPIGSNIPRKGKAPEASAASAPGPYVSPAGTSRVTP